MSEDKVCGLCGHVMNLARCGWGSVGDMPLCHSDDHSCYHRWTVYGERPNPDLTSVLDRALAEIQDTVENPERICSLSYEEARAVFVELRALRAKDEAAAAVVRAWQRFGMTYAAELWPALNDLARAHGEGR